MPKIPPKISIQPDGLLSWNRCYADVGDTIIVYPLLPPGADPFQAEVVKVSSRCFHSLALRLERCCQSGDGPAQYEWPPAVQEQWAKIDESIEQIKEMMERRLHTQWIG